MRCHGECQDFFDVLQLNFDFSVFPQGLIRRIENDEPVSSVEQDMFAGIQSVAEISFSPTTAGILKRPRHDRGMRSSTSDVRGESQDKLTIQCRGVRRRNVMRHNDLRRSMLPIVFVDRPSRLRIMRLVTS